MFAKTPEGVIISLYIQPGASKTEVIGEHNGLLKIKIKAPPVDGKANEEVLRFLSKVLNVSKSQIEILKGDKSREKKVLVRSTEIEAVQKSLI
jgi:uncharacterized protein (TIGR00251 family)